MTNKSTLSLPLIFQLRPFVYRCNSLEAHWQCRTTDEFQFNFQISQPWKMVKLSLLAVKTS